MHPIGMSLPQVQLSGFKALPITHHLSLSVSSWSRR